MTEATPPDPTVPPVVGPVPLGQMNRVLPHQHPELPYLYARRAELVQGQGAWVANTNVVAVDRNNKPQKDNLGNPIQIDMIGYLDPVSGKDDHCCRMAVHYREIPYEIRSDDEMRAIPNTQQELERYVERDVSYGLRLIGRPGLLRYLEGPVEVINTVVPENASQQQFPTQVLTYTWHEVTDINYSAWAAASQGGCVGAVNADVFDGASNGAYQSYPKGTLLCKTPQRRRYRNAIGRVVWRVVYTFDYNPVQSTNSPAVSQGWNVLPGHDGKNYLAGFGTAGVPGPPLYPYIDFNQLFVVPMSPRIYQ